ncbi:hypothetical protein [Leifsonia sp. RAF41]|uniref:hypothetical protein n=1 Tax=Leifsonia sp. RAF41 TaxID=3233056 RepID=UPI003F9DB86F
MPSPETPTLILVMYISAWLLFTLIGLLILWAIIRGAVLSALRKHERETRQLESTRTGRIPTNP